MMDAKVLVKENDETSAGGLKSIFNKIDMSFSFSKSLFFTV